MRKGMFAGLILAGLALSPRATLAVDCEVVPYGAYSGDLSAVLSGLDQGCSADTAYSGNSALYYAINEGHDNIAVLLLNRGADPNIANADTWTALEETVKKNDLVAAQALLDHGADPNRTDSDDWSPLLVAAEKPQNTQMIALLLENHADPNLATSAGWTAISIALNDAWVVNKDHKEETALRTVELLLVYGADPNRRSPERLSPLANALGTPGEEGGMPDFNKNANKQLFLALLAAGANPNTAEPRTGLGEVPVLYYALQNSDPDFPLALLKAGADWKWAGAADEPLASQACLYGPQRIKLLARYGVDFNWETSANVADNDDCLTKENLAALVDVGVYLDSAHSESIPDDEDESARSPLAHAAGVAPASMKVKLLIDAGADLPSPIKPGVNPLFPDSFLLDMAATNMADAAGVYRVLIDYGVDLLGKNQAGRTPLEEFDSVNKALLSISDRGSLATRQLLVAAIKTRKVTRGFIASAMVPVESAKPADRPGMCERVLADGIPMYRKDPGSIMLRTALAEAANCMALPPPPSPEAVAHEQAALTLYAKAKTRSEVLQAAVEYEQAESASPWVPVYLRNLCTIYELGGAYSRAKRNCMMYQISLAFKDHAADDREVQATIERLDAEIAMASAIDWCNGDDRDTAQVIAGCTSLIQSGQLSGPSLANVFNNRGIAYGQKSEYDEAIEDYTQAIKLNPSYAEAFGDRGNAYLQKGEYDEAIEDSNQAVKLNPSYTAAFTDRAYAYEHKGEYDRAIQDYSQVIALQPNNADGLNSRCYDRAIVGQLRPALEDCNQSLSLRPNNADTLDSRCFVYLKMNNPDAAIADCDAALAINPKMPSSLYSRGLAEQIKGDTAASNADIATAKAIQPDIDSRYAKMGIPVPAP